MKRTAKLIALAAVLALCLVMTGCYVAPEDDVNNGGETNAGNNLPFQTLQPTATVTMTPDTVTVETPNPNQGQQGQNIFPDTSTPTPTPGPGGNWNDWGTTGDPNATAAPRNDRLYHAYSRARRGRHHPDRDGVAERGGTDDGRAPYAHSHAQEHAAGIPGRICAHGAEKTEGTGLLHGQR